MGERGAKTHSSSDEAGLGENKGFNLVDQGKEKGVPGGWCRSHSEIGETKCRKRNICRIGNWEKCAWSLRRRGGVFLSTFEKGKRLKGAFKGCY